VQLTPSIFILRRLGYPANRQGIDGSP
jgi:hypothetical protein